MAGDQEPQPGILGQHPVEDVEECVEPLVRPDHTEEQQAHLALDEAEPSTRFVPADEVRVDAEVARVRNHDDLVLRDAVDRRRRRRGLLAEDVDPICRSRQELAEFHLGDAEADLVREHVVDRPEHPPAPVLEPGHRLLERVEPTRRVVGPLGHLQDRRGPLDVQDVAVEATAVVTDDR